MTVTIKQRRDTLGRVKRQVQVCSFLINLRYEPPRNQKSMSRALTECSIEEKYLGEVLLVNVFREQLKQT